MTWNPFDPNKPGEYASWKNHVEKYGDLGVGRGSTHDRDLKKPSKSSSSLSDSSSSSSQSSWFSPSSSSSNAACFPGDAKVQTQNGIVRIDTIKPGDTVMSWNIRAGELRSRQVRKVIAHADRFVWEIKFADSQYPIHVTGSHTLLTNHGWKKVAKLTRE